MKLITLKRAAIIEATYKNEYDELKRTYQTKFIKVEETVKMSEDETRLVVVDAFTDKYWVGPFEPLRLDVSNSNIDSVQEI